MSEPKELTTAEKAADEEADNAFLISKAEIEDMPSYKPQTAHAPRWPAVRKRFYALTAYSSFVPGTQTRVVVRRWRLQNPKGFCSALQIHQRAMVQREAEPDP
jgi:hypothetical protein